MPLVDSPSLDQFDQGMPEKLPDQFDKTKKQKYTIGGLLILLILLVVLNIAQSETGALLLGKGTLHGQVVGQDQVGITAEITLPVSGSAFQTDANGYFTLNNIPSGNITILIAYGGIGTEYTFIIQPGQTTEAGVLTVPTRLREDGSGRVEWR